MQPTTESPVVPDTAVPAPVEDHAAIAAAKFRDGDFVGAAAAFQAGYEATGDPALLFGRAQALRRAGSCAAAIDVFEEFIATSPPESDARAAQDVIEACRAILDAHDPTPAPLPAIVTDNVAPPPPPAPRWHRDVTGGVLLGTGLAVAVVGAVLYGTSFAQADDRSGSEADYDDRRRRVRTLAATGGALLITGGALVIGSIVRYAVVAKRGRPSRVAWRGPLSWRF